jgi:hypothetical protein
VTENQTDCAVTAPLGWGRAGLGAPGIVGDMGDNFEVVVDVEAALDQAPRLARTVISWLTAEGTIDAPSRPTCAASSKSCASPRQATGTGGSWQSWRMSPTADHRSALRQALVEQRQESGDNPHT